MQAICRKRFGFQALVVISILMIPATAWGQYSPPAGTNELDRLLSPRTMMVGDFGLLDEYPAAEAINPAAAAERQRIHLNFSYLGIADFSNGGLDGHTVNLGLLYPTRAGVLGADVQFLHSGMQSFSPGTMVRAMTSFSKPLFENLLVGAGLDVMLGAGTQFAYGVSGRLGLIHRIELDNFKNARYGITLAGLGKWYTAYAGMSPYPAPFTPSVEFAFSPIENETLVWDVYSRFSLVFFQNPRFNLGTELNIGNTISIAGGFGLDAHTISNDPGNIGNYLPSLGISMRFVTDFDVDDDALVARQGWQRSEVRIQGGAMPMPQDTWVIGGGLQAALGVVDTNPPEIRLGGDDVEYISPNNDGIQDDLELSLEIDDERFVSGYRLEITNDQGELVRTIANIDPRPQSTGVRNIIDRLLAVTDGVEIPAEISWNGRTESGSIAADGNYTFILKAWDDNENTAITDERQVIVDTAAPRISINAPVGDQLIFSPSEGSFQQEVEIGQSGSVEFLWEAQILDAQQQPVMNYKWENAAPETVVWGGQNATGEIVPDGVYEYRIFSRDKAGNTNNGSVENIIVNTEPTPLEISLSASVFSPNQDGVQDSMRIFPKPGNLNGIRSWQIDIVPEGQNGAVRTITGGQNVPTEGVFFDGQTDSGNTLSEGRYKALLTVTYSSGRQPKVESGSFIVDVSAPASTVRAEFPAFSPNNSGIRDQQLFQQDFSTEFVWHGFVVNEDDEVVREFIWNGNPPVQHSWDGRNQDGSLAADGQYQYYLYSVDRAGNEGTSNRVSFELNTEETPVLVTSSYDAFSPDNDGRQDSISIIPSLKKTDDIEYFTFDIQDDQGNSIRSVRGSGSLTQPFVWDGKNGAGVLASDGEYRGRLEVMYINGNLEVALTDTFILDTEDPQAEIAADFLLFSPDGDEARDVLPVTQQAVPGDFWLAMVQNSEGETVRDYRWGFDVEDFAWDGLDNNGNHVSDGRYSYVLRSEDAAGNRSEYTLENIVVDTRAASVFVTIDYPAISPGTGNGRSDQVINLFTNLTDGIEQWSLEILNSQDTVVHSVSGTTLADSTQIRWDGTDTEGNVVEGGYFARFTVQYTKGNRPQKTSREFFVDVSPPEVDITLGPLPFSPDNDGTNDVLTIDLDLQDVVGVASWALQIFDRNDELFYEIQGTGSPESALHWDGRSSINGESVISAEDYPYELIATDVLGNSQKYSGNIPVDILVVRDGDRLKVRIPSIIFTPNSSALVLDPNNEVGRKNLQIIQRLAEIFSRYRNYQIRVEGHAVNLSGTVQEDEEVLQPLSLSRAESVRQILIESGIDPERVSAAGRGGMEPIVPHSDTAQRWKNRRVEFILIR